MPEPIPSTSRIGRSIRSLDSAADAGLLAAARAGRDLSSHIYNAWLTQNSDRDRAHAGIGSGPQTTNILFDLMLSASSAWRAELRNGLVSIAVLVFVGAHSASSPWLPAAAVAPDPHRHAGLWMGVPHGLFLILPEPGLCFWALATAWNGTRRGLAMARRCSRWPIPGTFCPWCGPSPGVYYFAASRIAPRDRGYLSAAWLLAMAALHALIARWTLTTMSAQQIKMSTAPNQVWVFDDKYYWCWPASSWSGAPVPGPLRHRGARELVGSVPFQFCVISAAAVVILPSTVSSGLSPYPDLHHGAHVAGCGICVCALLGSGRPRVFERYAPIAVRWSFSDCSNRDERILNSD